MDTVKIGIIICDRYRRCAGGKCLRSLRNREGAFSRYRGMDAEIVGYTTCDGCPGGNVEYAVDEMKANGAEVIHLATGLIVGYPPCPRITFFHDYIEARFGLEVVYGTHPIPQKYLDVHSRLRTWDSPAWKAVTASVMADEAARTAYN